MIIGKILVHAQQRFIFNTYQSLFPRRSSLVNSGKDCGLNSYTVLPISSNVDDPADWI